MTTPHDDDPTRAALRVADGVVGLVRAELGLALVKVRASGTRLAVTLAFAVAAWFSAAVAFIVIVLTPMFWTRSPAAALATLAIAVTFALVTSVATLLRLRAQRKPPAGEHQSLPTVENVSGRDHAIPG